MKRALLTVAVAAMLVLAGCNGGGQGTASPNGNETATDGEADIKGDVSTPDAVGVDVSTYGPGSGDANSVSDDLYPPGIAESGVTNVSTLLRAHIETVFPTSSETRTELIDDRRTVRIGYRDGATGQRITYVNETADRRTVSWANETTITQWDSTAAPAITHSVGSTPSYSGLRNVAIVGRLAPPVILNQSSLSVDGTTTVDGQRVVRLSIDGISPSPSRPFHQNIRDVSGYALVTPEGVIREIAYEGTSATSGRTLGMTMSVSEVGSTTVTRPEWAGGYPTVNVSTNSDGTLLTLRHEGGPAISADTRIRVGDTIPLGNATVPETFEAGETLHLVPSGTFGNYTFDASVGDRPSITDDTSELPGSTPSVSLSLDGVRLLYGPPVESGTDVGSGT